MSNATGQLQKLARENSVPDGAHFAHGPGRHTTGYVPAEQALAPSLWSAL